MPRIRQNILFSEHDFEVKKLKYLGVAIKDDNRVEKDNSGTVAAENKAFYSFAILLIFKLLKNTPI